jgi:hypothetical protein
MNTKILSIVVGIMFLNSSLFSQIENEITSFVDSTEITINNGRRLLVSKVQAGEKEKVLEIYNYLSQKTIGKSCAAF